MPIQHSQNPELSIIIINYNTKQLTCDCIASIQEKTRDLTYEIIVVDNNSHDDSVAFLKQNFPDIILLESHENIGFGRANNLAASIARAETLLFLNSDTVIIDNSIKILYDHLSQHPETGVCGGLLLNADGSIGYSSSPQLTLTHYFRLYLPPLKKTPVEQTATAPTEVGYIIGADMMVRKDVFEKAGRFDPDFFLYCEESELSYRIKKTGYRIQLIPSARIVHLGGMSGSSKEELNHFTSQEQWYSRFLYFYKVYNQRHAYFLFLLYLAQCSLSLLKASLTFNPHRHKVWLNRLHDMRNGFRKYKKYMHSKKYPVF